MSSVLINNHQKLGGKIIQSNGHSLVMDYGNPVEEHKNVRTNVGIIDLSETGKLKLTGKDCVAYLHNRLSNSIDTLKPGEGCYATLLDFKGRILSDLWVYRMEDEVIIHVSIESKQALYENFVKFIFSEDVKVEDITSTFGCISIHGPKSKILLERLFNESPLKIQNPGIEVKLWNPSRGYILHNRFTGEEGYHLFYSMEIVITIWNELLQKGKDLGARPFGVTALESLRIEAGIPVFGHELDNDTIPLEANLKNAISYTKGCYPGQEIIAKITNLSHPKRFLVGLETDNHMRIPEKTKIYKEDIEIGIVTSSCFSPTFNKFISMGYVQWGNHEPDTLVVFQLDNQKIPGKVKGLPFYK